MPKTRILITGGNGYVGRYVTRLLAAEHELCIVDMLRYGDWRFAPDERAGLRLECVDIRDPDEIARVMDAFHPAIIIHLAAIHYIPECEQQPLLAVSTNVLGTLNLLLAAPAGARFILASSGAVYQPENTPHSEVTSPVGPSDVYGRSKLQAEDFVRDMATRQNLAAVIVRLFNVIGAGETNPHLLPELIAQLKAGRRTIDLGNLTPKRDYIAVRDAARGFVAAALGQAVSVGTTCTVNLGTSQAISVADVIGKLRHVCGIPFEIRQDASRVRRVDRPFLAADIAGMGSKFGWRPEYSIDDVLIELWRDPDLAPGLVARYQ